MEDTGDILPENFRSQDGFRSVESWIGRGGLRIVGFRSAQAKIPGKLQNALRALKLKDGRWQMFLRDHTCETGKDFPVYTWQNGCWELVREDPWIHKFTERQSHYATRSALRTLERPNRISIWSGMQAEGSALDRKPSAWRMRVPIDGRG